MSKETVNLSREEIAKIEIGRTDVSPAVARFLVGAFLAVICVVPVIQQVHDVAQYFAGVRPSPVPQCYEIYPRLWDALGTLRASDGTFLRRVFRTNSRFLRDIHQYEDAMENESVVGRLIRPPVQAGLTRWLGAGNEKAYCGVRPWLFYRPGMDYLTGPGFLDPERLALRAASGNEWNAAPQPDPVKAIVGFHEQLAARGIRLVVMPVPIKPMIHPEKFTGAYRDTTKALQNPSYARFLQALEGAGVTVCDVSGDLVQARREDAVQFLAADTHWTPPAMELAAKKLADLVRAVAELAPIPAAGLTARAVDVTGAGDILAMLQLPADQRIYPREAVKIRQIVTARSELWQADPAADVLVLGDSFGNIYSMDAMGWGESAGLVEQLSFELQRPVDRIVLNDNGAFAARAALARELARGRDRLKGKAVVIYQFAMRELAEGDWKIIGLDLGEAPASTFYVPPPGSEVVARGQVAAVGRVPLPGSVPYKDHVVAVHLQDLEAPSAGMTNAQAVVYAMSMKDNVWTPAARLRPGDAIELKLKSWFDVAGRYEGFNRGELDDVDLQLQEPCWGEF